jgi:hypothetical protein
MSRLLLPSAPLLALIAATIVTAENVPATRISLKGLGGVAIRVEPIDPQAQRDGLLAQDVQLAVRSQLDKAGISVLTPRQQQLLPRKPCLRISVATSKLSTGEHLYSIQVEVLQWVASLANPTATVTTAMPMPAQTWSATQMFGIAPAAQIKQDARDAVRAMVDEFIDAYGKANPSETATPARRDRVQ